MIKNKVAIVTGGSSGIGKATVEKFRKNNVTVFVLDIQSFPSQNDPSIISIDCNVADYDSVLTAFKKISEQTDHIDYLVLNAGIHYFGKITDTSFEKINEIININLIGALSCLKEALPHMVKHQAGSIVIMGSDQSFIGKKSSSIYGLSKAALGQLTKSTALDYAEDNIRVNCVCPATIETPLYKKAIQNVANQYFDGNTAELEENEKAVHPIQRIGTPEEVANVIWFLCSDESSFMTGSLVPVDGGYTAQ